MYSTTNSYDTVDSLTEQEGDRACYPCELMKVESNKTSNIFTAQKLHNDTARAKIAAQYGFEYNSIKIEADCWYIASDMNYFRFEVRGWHYIVRDFGPLDFI